MATGPRINVYCTEANQARIRDVCARHGFSLSGLFEATALCLSDEELAQLKLRYDDMKELERQMGGFLQKEVLERLRGLSPQKLLEVMEVVKKTVLDQG